MRRSKRLTAYYWKGMNRSGILCRECAERLWGPELFGRLVRAVHLDSFRCDYCGSWIDGKGGKNENP